MSTIGSTSSANSQLSYQIGMAVLNKAKDAAEQQGQAVLALLSDAAEFAQAPTKGGDRPGVGLHLDVSG